MEDDELRATAVQSDGGTEQDAAEQETDEQEEHEDALRATKVAAQDDAAATQLRQPASLDAEMERTTALDAEQLAEPDTPEPERPLPPPRPQRKTKTETKQPTAPTAERLTAAAPGQATAPGTLGPTPFGVPLARTDLGDTGGGADEAAGKPDGRPAPTRRLVALAAALLVAALAVGYGVVTALSPARGPAKGPRGAGTAPTGGRALPHPGGGTASAASQQPQPTAAARGAVSGSGSSRAAPRVRAPQLASCVLAAFDATAELDDRQLEPVCTDAEVSNTIRTMSAVAARTAGAETLRGRWAGLGWYRAAALQLARRRCCGALAPLRGPEVLGACQLDEALAAIDAADGQTEADAATRAYGKAIDCLFKAQAAQHFGMVRRPAAHQAAAFERLWRH